MFGRTRIAMVIAWVACCPVICGSAPSLPDHGDPAPMNGTPHAPHDSCDFDQCFCNGPSAPTPGPAHGLPAPAPSLVNSPADCAGPVADSSGFVTPSDRPPRLVEFNRPLPLLI